MLQKFSPNIDSIDTCKGEIEPVETRKYDFTS